MPKKITVVGAGNVGASVAQYCQLKDLGEIVMLDIADGLAKGKALDLSQASALQGFDATITGTGDYADTANSDVVVVTAGIARKPGMSRDDLVKTNLKIVSDVIAAAVKVSPNAIFVIVSNPLDIMCSVAQKVSGLPKERVVGLSGMLDAARLKYYLAEATGVSPRTVNAIVLGEHGDSMVALPRLATIGGVPAPNFLTEEEMAVVAEKTAKGGAAVVALIGVSAWYAPGLSTATMVEAIIKDTHAVMPCSAYLTGQYGAKDMYMCCPIRLGAKGVEEIIEVDLNAAEKAAVANSILSIKEKLKVLDTL